MCFIIHPDHREPKIATEDIICYKVFENPIEQYRSEDTFFSIMRNFPYQKGAKYDIERIKPKNDLIEEGFHSYAKPCTLNEITLNESKCGWNGWVRSIQVKCKIPSGTLYYYNPNSNDEEAEYLSEYVSESIIIGIDDDIIPHSK